MINNLIMMLDIQDNKLAKSIYIHIPFCGSICSYCDFCKLYYNREMVDKYLNGLANEINNKYKNELIETIYIGGGTPSFLSINELNKLFDILKNIKLASNYEFTFECNVLDLVEEKLIILKQNGVNRLSIGVESFNNKVLSFLERNYTKDEIFEKVSLAKKYFSNINVDLMYAVPSQTIQMLKDDLDCFLRLNVNHISMYSLIIEEHTKLAINNTSYIDDELDYDMYKLICDTLKDNDYIHYEISNFSKENYQSKHNLTYWNNLPYYGFGLGASGYLDNIRYTNTRSLNKYLEGKYVLEEEIIDEYLLASNYAVLGFRTIYGVNKKEFFDRFGVSLIDYFNVKDLITDNIILENDKCYYINPEYWYILNEILVKFI